MRDIRSGTFHFTTLHNLMASMINRRSRNRTPTLLLDRYVSFFPWFSGKTRPTLMRFALAKQHHDQQRVNDHLQTCPCTSSLRTQRQNHSELEPHLANNCHHKEKGQPVLVSPPVVSSSPARTRDQPPPQVPNGRVVLKVKLSELRLTSVQLHDLVPRSGHLSGDLQKLAQNLKFRIGTPCSGNQFSATDLEAAHSLEKILQRSATLAALLAVVNLELCTCAVLLSPR